VAEATRAGRQALLARPERRLGFHLQDWLVPVLYQQSPLALDFAKTSTAHPPDLGVIIPEEARLDNREAPHGFIGRDSAILALERASRRPPAGLLVHGLGGVGKTTLLRGYIEWLAQTRGLPETILWFSFSEVRSFDYVLNRLAERLLGANALAGSDEEKWQAVCQHLREHAALIVWDNFEAVSGQDDAVSELAFPSAERDQLKLLLEELRGGRSRVLLSSRTNEEWLGTIACYRLLIGGLEGEERQALARAVLSDQGIRFDPRDQEVADLIDSLDGHPLMMRALLPQLAFQNAKALRDAFEKYLPSMDGDNQSERRLAASLRYVDNELPDRLKPLLYPIGLHVGYVRVHYLEEMAKQAKQPFSANDIAETLSHMERAGLVQSTADDYYRLHPALARYLRARARDGRDTDQSVSWHAAFIHTAAFLVSTASFSNLAERHAYHHVFGGTIERARNLVDREDWEMFDGLTLFLAAYAYENNELHRAKRLYGEMLEHLPLKDQRGVRAAGTHLNLGLAALNEGDPVRALQSFEHARALFQELGNDSGVAQASQYIGLTHFEQGDTTKAESWFTNALTTFEGLRDEKQVSYLLHELGNCELRNRNLKKAEVLYLRSVEIKERLGDSKGAAITYQQMAGLAQDRGDLAAAESWYNRALSFATAGEEIEHQSYIYHGLGVIAQVRGDYVEAERLYVKSLQQKEKRGDRHGASLTYHQLGVLCMIRSDFEAAESWTQKSLEISREVNDKSGLTKSLVQLGVLAKLQGKPAEMHFLVASQIATEINDREALAIISEVRRGPGLLYRLLERFRGWVS
jgi:tetratricopeptide (TPR) repeat protein